MPPSGFLVDRDIRQLSQSSQAVVAPLDSLSIRPASVDLRLSGKLYRYTCTAYRLDETQPPVATQEAFEDYELKPHQSVFVGLFEKISIPQSCVGFVFARSSITRLGLSIDPVYMNPGYTGHLPITIRNGSEFPIVLVKGVRVAQLICATLTSEPDVKYKDSDAKYVDDDMSPSRIYTDPEIQNAIKGVLGRYFSEDFVKSVT